MLSLDVACAMRGKPTARPGLAPRLMLGVAGLCLLASGCQRAEPDARLLPPLVRVSEARQALQPERGFTGVVAARVQSDLGFRIAGKVVERLVDSGQEVKRGQRLMRIDAVDLELATAARSSAVEAARARAARTAFEEQRLRRLVAKQAVSAIAYNQAKTAADAAAAEFGAAESESRVARNETSYAILAADADGVVVQTLAEPGQVVAAGQAVIRLAHAGPREAVVEFPETLRPEPNSKARAQLYGDEGVTYTATLRQLAESANALTRTYEARYVLDGAAASAPLGATITVQVPDMRLTAAVQVPLSAVVDKGQGPGVWIIEPTSAERATVAWRAVTISAIGAEAASVSIGLSDGERFVAMGAHLLNADDAVRLPSPSAGPIADAAPATRAP